MQNIFVIINLGRVVVFFSNSADQVQISNLLHEPRKWRKSLENDHLTCRLRFCRDAAFTLQINSWKISRKQGYDLEFMIRTVKICIFVFYLFQLV